MIPFYIGTYTSGASKGIYRALLDSQTGRLDQLELVAEIDNPTFLSIHPSLPFVYACSEIRRDGKRSGAQLMAFRIEPTGQLTRVGGQPTGGSGPCYVSLDRTGRVALVANYASGSIAALPIAADGQLSPASITIQHTGSSVNPERQQGPHAHCIMPDPSNRFACAVDLGLDQVLFYALDSQSAMLSAEPSGRFAAQPGSGPRHIAFHPDGQHVFIINEMGNTITCGQWDASAGRLSAVGLIGTLPPDFTGENTTAEILVHPNGRFVYGSNRGHDTIAVFTFDRTTTTLALIEHVPSGGRTPRNFAIDPTGHYLLSENQDSDSIVAFKIDTQSGRLSATGHSISVGSPCCIKFATHHA